VIHELLDAGWVFASVSSNEAYDHENLKQSYDLAHTERKTVDPTSVKVVLSAQSIGISTTRNEFVTVRVPIKVIDLADCIPPPLRSPTPERHLDYTNAEPQELFRRTAELKIRVEPGYWYGECGQPLIK
jgi:hypothetical protein